jgi:hypothetical protein
MSLVINTTTPEGIIIAADSRQSYRNRKGISRIGSDNASKLFRINSRVGAAITGLAFIEYNGVLKNVGTIIDGFIETKGQKLEKLTVKEITNSLYEEISDVYDVEKQFDNLRAKINSDLTGKGCMSISFTKNINTLKFVFIDPEGNEQTGIGQIEQINFLVGGYNPDNSHEVNMCYIPGDIKNIRHSGTPEKEYGATWLGQTDVVSRIILGFDPRIGNLEFMKKNDPAVVMPQLRNLEYSIQWGTMTLQDGVDFSDLMIRTTSAIQRFSDGIVAEPGDIPGVGGEVDIAVITKKHGFKWINKKSVEYNGKKIELD